MSKPDKWATATPSSSTTRSTRSPARTLVLAYGSPHTDRSAARWILGHALPQSLPGGDRVSGASQSGSRREEQAQNTCSCATPEKSVDENLPPDPPRQDGSVRDPHISWSPRRKAHSVGRPKAARPSSRLLYSKPPLESFTKVSLNLPQERDSPENHPHATPTLFLLPAKPDISTWQRLGHFYLALTTGSGALPAGASPNTGNSRA